MRHLTLYTTLGCHLCERLEAMLSVLHDGKYRLEKVEISEDEALMARYGVRIPVLVDEAGDELDMGFEPPRLAAWLSERHCLDEAAWQRLGAQFVPQEAQDESKRSTQRPAERRYLG
ncbi:glutaredoxin family protein [Billgrantia diversa]|uniref:glutaredoxin family protein n=1 Tax=Halomonas sp. MCCC 1A13316 TaxID=2733487 RepID=UPI0018A51C1E|nr:glutaredoxin family protein [Halomonas sp. MCCC 1A13316]QOR38293.1 glutaredoxin family protein [Halomonas sp. MCCC 1A13316]